jgi:hypothetical protein
MGGQKSGERGRPWSFLRERGGELYLVTRWWDPEQRRRRESWAKVAPDEAEELAALLERRRRLEAASTEISCFNPDCSNSIRTTPQQKRDFLISFKLKYDKVVLPTCSEACRRKLLALLS